MFSGVTLSTPRTSGGSSTSSDNGSAADASGDAAQQLEDAKTIGTTPTELRNLTDAAADASRQNARARAAVDATQGPLQALRQQLR